MPNIRRFLLDHNVRWPNLVNGDGAHDYAAAYGVTEIPTNVLIGRDGTVIHVDLSRKNLAQVVARAVGRQQSGSVGRRVARQSAPVTARRRRHGRGHAGCRGRPASMPTAD